MSKKSKSSIQDVDAETSFIEKYDKPYPSPNYKLLFGVLIVILLAFGCVWCCYHQYYGDSMMNFHQQAVIL